MMANRGRRDGPKLRSILILLVSTVVISFVVIPVQNAWATTPLVQGPKNCSGSGTATPTCAFVSNVTSGNLLVVVCSGGSGVAAASANSASDSQGAYTRLSGSKASWNSSANYLSSQVFYRVSTSSAADTVTCTFNESVFFDVFIYEVKAVSTSGILTCNNSVGSSPATISCSSPISPSTRSLVIGGAISATSVSNGDSSHFSFLAGGQGGGTMYNSYWGGGSTSITFGSTGDHVVESGAAFPSTVVQISLTMSPSAGSNSIGGSNCFTITMTWLGGASTVCPAEVSAYTIYADQSTTVTISATSGSSSASENWCTQITTPSTCTAATFSSGSGQTLSLTQFYYDLLTIASAYSLTGGGSPTAPTLSYSTAPASAGSTDNPQSATLALTTSGQNVYMRRGSTYSATNPLGTSTSSERWLATSASGTASAVSSVTFAYYHQYACTCSYSVSGGGSPTAPTIASTAFGSASTVTLPSVAPATVFFDNGASYTGSPNPLTGSTSTQRWKTGATLTGTVSAAFTFAPTFYNQFLQTVSYSIVGGGSFTAPTFGYTTLGAPGNAPLTIAAQAIWADNNAPYSATNPLTGSTSSERAFSTAAVSGTISSAATLAFTYYHQISLQIKYTLDLSGPSNNPTFSITQYGAFNQYTNSLTSTTYWADYNQKFTAQTGWIETPGLKTEYAFPNAGTTVTPGPLIIAYRQASGCPSGNLAQLEQGCVVPSILNVWSAPIGEAPWLAFIILGINVAVYNKTQSVWISLIILMAAGGVFGYLLPVYVATIAQVFMYLGVAGIVLKAVLRVL